MREMLRATIRQESHVIQDHEVRYRDVPEFD